MHLFSSILWDLLLGPICRLSATTPPSWEEWVPEDALAIDMTMLPYYAEGDGRADDSTAIQRALNKRQPLIFLPTGTYFISSHLRWGKSANGRSFRVRAKTGRRFTGGGRAEVWRWKLPEIDDFVW